MKTLVTYYTRSGNTEKVAKAIYEELDEPKSLQKIKNDLKLEEFNLIFIGFPIENYWCPLDIHEFLKKNTENAKIVFFITHGVPEDNELLPEWIDRAKQLLPTTAEVIDQFTCQSEVAQYVVDALKKSGQPMQMEWAAHCKNLIGLPDENKLQKAKSFAKRIQTQFS